MTDANEEYVVKAVRLPVELVRLVEQVGKDNLPGIGENWSALVRYLLMTHPLIDVGESEVEV